MDNIKILKDYNLRDFNTFKFDCIADLYLVKDFQSLKKLIVTFYKSKQKYFILGNGSNLVLDNKLTIPVIKLDFPVNKDTFTEIKNEYVLPANIPLKKLTSIALKYSFLGWDVFTGIPASLGGAVFMNAGTGLGEISSLVTKVFTLLPDGSLKDYSGDELKFCYRSNKFLNSGEIIYKVSLKHLGINKEINKKIINYLQMRSSSQPLNNHSAGCSFKNKITKTNKYIAGQLIDLTGLKGLQYKNLSVSNVHGNFIINKGFANKEDLVKLLKVLDNELLSTCGFEFEKEIIL